MAMRMSGLMSGMDTESIVQQLVEARSAKVTKVKNSQTKLEWKQDIWKGLNTKLKTLQSKLNDLRFSSGYAKKTTKVSDSTAVSVLTSDSAVNGVQQLEVKQLAKTAYMTGGRLQTRDEILKKKLETMTVDEITSVPAGGATFEVEITDKEGVATSKTITVNAGDKVKDVLKKFQDIGLNADYDEERGKILFNSKDKESSVSFKGVSAGSMGFVQALTEPGQRKSTGDEVSALTKMGDLMVFQKDGNGDDIPKGLVVTAGDKDVRIELNSETTISDILTKMREAGVNATFDAKQERFFLSGKESGADYNFEVGGDVDALKTLGLMKLSGDEEKKGMTYVEGQDAIINLNNAEFTNSSNTFEINGLTLVAQNETNGKLVTLTTQQDTDGIYDKIKDFFKTYNEIINEMDKLYNADSAKGFEPLSDDEKYGMSESEIEKYEQKIKDSLLRRDENLSTVGNALKKIMLSGFSVNGKTMYLSNFGIETLDYFHAPDNERNAFHIDGDKDDTSSSANEDKLKKMIASDPDTVISFFTQLSQSLYLEMDKQTKSVPGTRSFGSFYDDKKMKSDYDDYKSKIKDMEKKLADYEDKWYAKFAAMETAMAKMQQNASAVTSMLGGGM